MELIKIEVVQDKETVNARELWKFLESKQEFSNWIKDRIDKYDFTQDTDFIKFDKLINSDSKPRIEYHLSLDMAKELSMVERNEKGRIARKYFIERDKKLSQIETKKLPQNYKEALVALVAEIEDNEKLEIELKEAQPKIDFVNHIEVSKDSISVADFAKLLHKKGLKLGQNKLFKYFYDQKYLMDSDKPYQKWMDQGFFEIKKIPFLNGRREEKVSHKVMITGKGQIKLTEVISNSFLSGQTQF